MSLTDFNFDILRYIGRWLNSDIYKMAHNGYFFNNDINKFSLMRTCKHFMKLGLMFENEYSLLKIAKSSLYNNFTNVFIGNLLAHMNTPIAGGCILKWPKNVRQIRTDDIFNASFDYNAIPSKVTHLTLGKSFVWTSSLSNLLIKYLTIRNKNAVSWLNLPDTIKYLSVVTIQFDSIPDSVTHLRFNTVDCYQNGYDVKKYIPTSVTHLIIDHVVNKDNNSFERYLKLLIPSSVTHLTLEGKFNLPIIGIIPKSVTHLTFGDYFDQSIKKSLPGSITHIIFGKKFNNPIKKYIPSSVKKIIIYNKKYSYPLPKRAMITKNREEINDQILSGMFTGYLGYDYDTSDSDN